MLASVVRRLLRIRETGVAMTWGRQAAWMHRRIPAGGAKVWTPAPTTGLAKVMVWRWLEDWEHGMRGERWAVDVVIATESGKSRGAS